MKAKQKILKGLRWVPCMVILSVLFCSCGKDSPAPPKEEQSAATTVPLAQGSNDLGLGDFSTSSIAGSNAKVNPKQALLTLFDSINPEIRVRIDAGQSEIYTAVGANHLKKLNELTALPGTAEHVEVKLFTNGIVMTPSTVMIGGHVFISDLTDASKPRPYVIYAKSSLRQ